mgnify:CR=1 FL=1
MVELRIDHNSVQEIDVLRSREMIHKHTGQYGSLCLVVRRPGWFLCREQALTLSVLAALYGDSQLAGFELLGVVKETGIDDEGLADFYHNYYGKYPLYCDKSYSFYQALGDRKAVELPSLFTLLTSFLDAWKRISSKGIQWNLKGEGIVKGGLIIFDAKGVPRYAYKEETGVDLPVQDIVKALEAIRTESQKESQDNGSPTTTDTTI